MAASATTSTSRGMSVSSGEAAKAQVMLTKMRRSLAAWLKYRRMNDQVVSGERPTKKPRAIAMQYVSQRDWDTEQKLADQLHALLEQVMPDASLPNPDLGRNPDAAVALAQIAITGRAPTSSSSPTPQGGLGAGSPPWLWPVLIVGGLLLATTTAIGSMADVAKSKEEYACIQAGACTDYGFWLKVGGVAMVGWFLWTQTSLKDHVRSLGRPRSHTRGG